MGGVWGGAGVVKALLRQAAAAQQPPLRADSKAGLRAGTRLGFYSCLWSPGQAAQHSSFRVPNCVMDRTVYVSHTLSPSWVTGEQEERPEREGRWGAGQGWHCQGEYLSRHWHPVSPTEPELVRLFGFLH